MAGDIKKFVENFNTELEKAIKKAEEGRDSYKNIYNECIALTASRVGLWPEDPSVKTIGDLYKYVFPDPDKPEKNEPDPRPGNNKYTPYYRDYLDDMTGKSSDNPTLEQKYEKLKRQGSQRLIENYNAIKKPGYSNPNLYTAGQYWFDIFMYVGVTSKYNELNDSKQDIFSDDQLKNFGTVSLAVFSRDDIPHGPTGSYLLHRDIAADYYEFEKLILRCEQRVSEITGVNIGLQETWNTESFGGLKTQYRSGVYDDLKKDPTFNWERGIHIDSQQASISWKKPVGEFIGNWENILLYNAVLEATDKYKPVTLPYNKPEPLRPDSSAAPNQPEQVSNETTLQSGDIVFNVEKKDTFTIVGGTVSGQEYVLVPNDGTSYIFNDETTSKDDFEDLDEEYQETIFAGQEEVPYTPLEQTAFKAEYTPTEADKQSEVNNTETLNGPVEIPKPKEGEMTISAAGLKKLKAHEGSRATIYDDATAKSISSYDACKGFPTVGVGHLIQSGERDAFKKYLSPGKMSDSEIENLLLKDLSGRITDLNKKLKVKVTQGQFDALLSMGFNTGFGNKSFLKAVALTNEGKKQEASAQINSGPKTSKGKELAGLVRRRREESEWYLA